MKILRKMIIVLVVILITSVIWFGTNIYLSYNSAELRGELLGSENIYEFLSKGMLDEVKITVSEKEDLEIEGFTVDLLEPIEPYFSKIAFEKIVEKIEKDLIVSPLEFHNLQNDAVMRSFEIEED
jgi:hypothetical protein